MIKEEIDEGNGYASFVRKDKSGKRSAYKSHETLKYLAVDEQAAQYPRIEGSYSSKIFAGREPKKYVLMKMFMDHMERFDEECKQKLFEFGEEVLNLETKCKYDR